MIKEKKKGSLEMCVLRRDGRQCTKRHCLFKTDVSLLFLSQFTPFSRAKEKVDVKAKSL